MNLCFGMLINSLWHALEKRDITINLWLGNLKGGDSSRHVGKHGRIVLNWITNKYDVLVQTRFD